eukprot:6207026-Pleurochrysis_carterae.AAC.1
MCARVCVRAYVCVCASLFVRACWCIQAGACVRVSACGRVPACACVRVSACVHVGACLFVGACGRARARDESAVCRAPVHLAASQALAPDLIAAWEAEQSFTPEQEAAMAAFRQRLAQADKLADWADNKPTFYRFCQVQRRVMSERRRVCHTRAVGSCVQGVNTVRSRRVLSRGGVL